MKYFGRKDLERREKRNLASYAMKSRNSRGRRWKETPDPMRTDFQLDRDRIVHAKSFRRLAHKTQVFPSLDDHVRTRLTHSMEVAQLGRTIARALRCNEDLVEAMCLLHDLGHPPFGHVGEERLNDLMYDVGGFDHNSYTYEIATRVELRRDGTPGLNLTSEVLESTLKHETEHDPKRNSTQEFCHVVDYRPTEKPTLEAQICNIVDSIAYNASDLDDYMRIVLRRGSSHGIKNLKNQLKKLKICNRIKRKANHPLLEGSWKHVLENDKARKTLIASMIDLEVKDCIRTTSKNITQAQIKSVDDVRQHQNNLVQHSVKICNENKQLQKFLYKHYYYRHQVRIYNLIGAEVIEQLFETYLKDCTRLPLEQQSSLETSDARSVVGKYIASMTDRYLFQQARKLNVASDLPLWVL